MIKTFAAAFAAASIMTGAASAAPVLFDFTGLGADRPENDSGVDDNVSVGGSCNGIGISGPDLCAIDADRGFDYSKDGVAFNATAVNSLGTGVATHIMQDLSPADRSGLAALTSGESGSDDQVQVARAESIIFESLTGGDLTMTYIDFNVGGDDPCSSGGGAGSEGVCGDFEFIVDGVSQGVFAAGDAIDLTTLAIADLTGEIFEIVARFAGDGASGWTIGQVAFESEIPVPGAAVLLLSGLAGLGFSSRRKRAA